MPARSGQLGVSVHYLHPSHAIRKADAYVLNIGHRSRETGQPRGAPNNEKHLRKNEYYHYDLRRDSWLSILVLEDLLATIGMVSRAQTGSSQLLVRGIRYSDDN